MAYLLCVYELRSSVDTLRERKKMNRKKLLEVHAATMTMRDYKMHTVNVNHYWNKQLTHKGKFVCERKAKTVTAAAAAVE